MEQQVHQLIVRKMIETVGNYTRVTVDNETFNKVRGRRPSLPYKPGGPVSGGGCRRFDFDGKELLSIYDKDEGTTAFFMKTEDAQALLSSLEDERASEEKIPLDVNAFTSMQKQTA